MTLAEMLAFAKEGSARPRARFVSPSPPVVPARFVRKQGKLWGEVDGATLPQSLQDQLAVWARVFGLSMPEPGKARWAKAQRDGATPAEFSALVYDSMGYGTMSNVWAVDEEGRAVSVKLFSSSIPSGEVRVGAVALDRVLSPKQVLAIARVVFSIPTR